MKRSLVIAAVAGLALTTAACGGSSSSTGSASAGAASSSSAPMAASDSASSTASSASAAAMSAPVGPGCADYAAKVPTGAGSVDGMAKDPVAVAASNNPVLKNLVAAVSGKLNPKVDLVDTLNSGEFTVFAPVDSAFAQVPAVTLTKLKTDSALLTKILTYHVLPMQVSPDKIIGQQKTVEGSTVTVAGTPNALTVNGIKVICGGVHTANATVYLIDGVLTPTK
jgi:uncharacterized surface protein with fasciclin (FAS1) repeats